jgi:hypothetical protein
MKYTSYKYTIYDVPDKKLIHYSWTQVLPAAWYHMPTADVVRQSWFSCEPAERNSLAIIVPEGSNLLQRYQSLQQVARMMFRILTGCVLQALTLHCKERDEQRLILAKAMGLDPLPSIPIGFVPDALAPFPSSDVVLDAELEAEINAIHALLSSAPRLVNAPLRCVTQRRIRSLIPDAERAQLWRAASEKSYAAMVAQLPDDHRARALWRQYEEDVRDHAMWHAWAAEHATEALWQRIVAAASRVAKYVRGMQAEIDAQLGTDHQTVRMLDIVASLSDERIAHMTVYCTRCGAPYDEVTCTVSKRELLTGSYCGQLRRTRGVSLICCPKDRLPEAIEIARQRTSRGYREAFYRRKNAERVGTVEAEPLSDDQEAQAVERARAMRAALAEREQQQQEVQQRIAAARRKRGWV